MAAQPASAQDLLFHFVDPSFGGNPFYSDHLLATATVTRPAAPTTPTTPQTQEELLASQLRAQLLSTLSGNIRDAINNAKVGESNTYTFGNQVVSYARTATGTSVTFTNTDTGAVNTVVIPASGTSTTTAAAVEAARANAAATSTNIALTGSLTGVSTLGSATSSAAAASANRTSAEQVLSASSGAALSPL